MKTVEALSLFLITADRWQSTFVHFGRHKSQDPAVRKGTFGIRFLGGKDAGRIRESERDGDESAVRSPCCVCCCGGMGPIHLRPRL